MRAIGISSKSIKQPHPEEVLVYPKAGDILMFHCSVLHSGSINLSTDYRYLFFITLNHSWLKHWANFQGPVCQNIIANARSQGDKRMLRLLGVDEEFVTRANCGFREPDEINWQRWIAEESNQKS